MNAVEIISRALAKANFQGLLGSDERHAEQVDSNANRYWTLFKQQASEAILALKGQPHTVTNALVSKDPITFASDLTGSAALDAMLEAMARDGA